MSRGYQNSSEREGRLDGILQMKGARLERGRRVIDKLIERRSGRIVPNNPEYKYHKNNPQLQALQHYSHSQYSVDRSENEILIPPRALPRLSPSQSRSTRQQNYSVEYLTQQQLLAEQARQFVNRLRKQKRYEYGRALVLRKKQEEDRKKRQLQRSRQRQRYQELLRLERKNLLIDKILLHQERISNRMKNSINRYRQCKRFNTESIHKQKDSRVSRSALFDYDTSNESGRESSMPMIAAMKKRLDSLKSMVDSLHF